MKLRSGFVSNSSTASFIIKTDKDVCHLNLDIVLQFPIQDLCEVTKLDDNHYRVEASTDSESYPQRMMAENIQMLMGAIKAKLGTWGHYEITEVNER